jgi:ATP-dependent exoDNAse (exonuclease V) beta subunit
MSFTVYRSSAGSGKTYTLVREYLKIILDDTDSFRNILAVTFTNKAAGEMKSRVLNCLQELSGHEAGKGRATKTLLPSLIEETGYSATEISQRSSEALKKILHHYSDFAIGTIDSFSHRVIRAFAHDFGLPLNFKVEMDADELIETAVDLLLDKAGDDEQLTSLLVNFLENNLEDNKSWAIDKSLMEFSKLLLDEESQQQLSKLRQLSIEDFKNIALFLRKKTREFETALKDEAGSAWKAISNAGLDHSAFAYGKSGISWYFEQLASGRLDKIIPVARLVSAIEKDSWSSGKASSADKEIIETIKPLLLSSFQMLLQMTGNSYPLYKLHKLLMKSVYPLAVLNSIDLILQEFKKQNNIIHISEFNSRIARIVMGEPLPFIYERTGEKYRHILIDEFQDTSALQWQNFVPLIENSLASGYFNLVVGDGKQAIYRWRNGDVEQFTNLPALKGSEENTVIGDRQQALTRNFVEHRLDKNFRSLQEIVNFNNDFFGFVSSLLDEPRKKVYDELMQNADAAKQGGCIRISFIGKGEDEEVTVEDAMLEKVIAIIAECRGEGYGPSDIAVLCRSNREASLIAQTLIGEGIPVVSGESLLLNYSPLVRMLTGLARYIFGPVNPVIQAEILTRFYQLFPADKHFYQSWLNMDAGNRTKLFEGFFNDRIGGEWVGALRTLPVYDLFIKLVNSFCPYSAGDPYIQFFLNAVLKFGSGRSSSAPDFLEWWDEHHEKLSVIMPSGLDAVQVMTIHKAKGLQFPVVIYPFAGDALKNTKKYLWATLDHNEVPGLAVSILSTEKDIEETAFAEQYLEEREKSKLDLVNVLYVVMTRPEQRLYLIPPLPKKSGETDSVPAFLKAWLQHKELWDDKRNEYEFGYRAAVNPAVKESVNVLPLPGLKFGDWREAIRIRSSAPAVWNPDDPDRNRRYGNVLHTVLEGLTPGKDAGEMIDMMLESGLLDRAWENEVRSKINKILNDPGFAFIFDKNADVRPEAEILTKQGHAIRPDRVIIKDGRAVIVDYKTGRPMEKYKTQLMQYAAYLEDLGYKDVKKYLLYLEPDVRLEEVKG